MSFICDADPRLNRWAEVIVDFCTEVKAGERVEITGEIQGKPLMLALYRREVTGQGGKVTTSLMANGAWANSCSVHCPADTTLKALLARSVSAAGVVASM